LTSDGIAALALAERFRKIRSTKEMMKIRRI
jgi:hypothetical protein